MEKVCHLQVHLHATAVIRVSFRSEDKCEPLEIETARRQMTWNTSSCLWADVVSDSEWIYLFAATCKGLVMDLNKLAVLMGKL